MPKRISVYLLLLPRLESRHQSENIYQLSEGPLSGLRGGKISVNSELAGDDFTALATDGAGEPPWSDRRSRM